MDLLSELEKEEVFAALKDVTDTFHKDIIILKKYEGSFSRMDTGENEVPVSYNLLCRIEKEPKDNDAVDDVDGRDDRSRIRISFFRRYLVDQGLIDSAKKVPNINTDTDYFYLEGLKYRPKPFGDANTDFMGESALIIYDCFQEDKQGPVPVEAITVGAVGTDEQTYQGNDGSIEATPSGGIPPYTYELIAE